jgi:hypothetical protein
MSRVICNVIFLACLAAACEQSGRPSTQPIQTQSETRKLIGQLASHFPPEHENGSHGSKLIGIGSSDEQSPRSQDAMRVEAARQSLTALGIAAFPDLVAASDDDRYSYSQVNAALWNYSVGDACFGILESQVDFYGCGYKSRDGAEGRSAVKPSYLRHARHNGGLAAWWASHQGRAITELQIESLRWTISQEESIGFVDAKQRREIIEPLETRLATLVAIAPSR